MKNTNEVFTMKKGKAALRLVKSGKKKLNYIRSNDLKKYIENSSTLLEFDYDEFEYQRLAGTQMFSSEELMNKKAYHTLYLPDIYLEGYVKTKYDMFRRYVSGSIQSARFHILERVSERLTEYLDKKIPKLFQCIYEPTPSGGSICHFDNRYFGKKKEHENVAKFLRDLQGDIEKDIVENYLEDISLCVFKQEDQEPYAVEPHTIFIIGGVLAAENIVVKNFFEDFADLEESLQVLRNIEKTLYKKYKKRLSKKIKKELKNAK